MVDVATESYRKSSGRDGRCSSIFNFVFDWASLFRGYDHRPVSSGQLRVFQQVIPRFISIGNTSVTVNTSMRYLAQASSSPNVSTRGERTFAGSQHFLITNNSNGWVMVDVTEGLKALWPPRLNSTVEITARVTVNCEDRRKVPINFLNPADVPPAQTQRREKYLVFQPLLVLHLHDEMGLKKGNEVEGGGPELKEGFFADETSNATYSDDIYYTNSTHLRRRRRRSTGSNICTMLNYSITFADIYVPNILTPSRYNIGMCSGNCSAMNMRQYHDVEATNHARIFAAAVHYGIEDTSLLPCCVPTKYSPAYLMLQHGNDVEVRLFPEFRVERCGCR